MKALSIKDKIILWRKNPLFFFTSLALIYGALSMFETWAMATPAVDHVLDRITYYVAVHSDFLYNFTSLSHSVFFTGDSVGIMVDGKRAVHVSFPCNGFTIWLIFIAFILSVGGPKKHLLWFLPLGIISIHIINVIRVFALSLIARYHHDWVEFNHKYVFTILVYSWVLFLFMWWIKRFSTIREVKQA